MILGSYLILIAESDNISGIVFWGFAIFRTSDVMYTHVLGYRMETGFRKVVSKCSVFFQLFGSPVWFF